MTHKTTVLIALMVTGGCTADLDLGSDQQAACSPLICTNSPEVAQYGLWEASLRGVPDVHGLYIQTKGGIAQIVSSTGVTYNLSVQNGFIRGTRNNGAVISGQGLVGAEITMMLNKKPLFMIHIDSVAASAFPVGAADPMEYYVMTWHEPGMPPSPDRHLCNELEDSSLEKDPLAGLWGMAANQTLVFEGDRFDPYAMTANPSYDATWFNFGCAGHTLAKLQLTRHTTIAGNPVWAERQASMKLLAADYCGTGTAYTSTGVHLMWMDQRWLTSYPANVTSLEARWNENGATCLDKPRSADPVVVRAECPSLPLCTNQDPLDYDGSLLISAN